jgi:hypothetical protein
VAERLTTGCDWNSQAEFRFSGTDEMRRQLGVRVLLIASRHDTMYTDRLLLCMYLYLIYELIVFCAHQSIPLPSVSRLLPRLFWRRTTLFSSPSSLSQPCSSLKSSSLDETVASVSSGSSLPSSFLSELILRLGLIHQAGRDSGFKVGVQEATQEVCPHSRHSEAMRPHLRACGTACVEVVE